MFNERYYIDYYSTTRALIGQNQSRDPKVSLLRGCLSVHSAPITMCDRFPRKFDVQTSYNIYNICCEHQISSGNLSHDSDFDRRPLLFISIYETSGWCCSRALIIHSKSG